MNKFPRILAGMAVLALSISLTGCDRTISKSEKTSTGSDGTVKKEEKTVTRSPDGTVTKTEESSKTAPERP
jgi:hypothetical protein